ncbi:MAG: BlaI/MecI/CopY family transcriptional regulator [Gammaproteobacteria bacterium]
MPVFPTLGDLEVAILEFVWRHPDTTVKDTHAAVGTERAISLNTIQSTLERLVRKQLLSRRKVGHSFEYSPQVSRDELITAAIHDALGRFGADPSAALANFIDSTDIPDEEALRLLERKLRRRLTRQHS